MYLLIVYHTGDPNMYKYVLLDIGRVEIVNYDDIEDRELPPNWKHIVR
jgi:hypothetical protein